MLSSSAKQLRNKIKDAGSDATRRLRSSAVSLVPGPKPLTKYRFYLDVKNHITSGKLETKIKSFGGTLELFLVKEVTHVVTDKEEWSSGARGVGSLPKTPQTPQQPQDASLGDSFNQPGIGNGTTAPARGRPKTRADAMLERARSNTPTQPNAAQHRDTFKQAKAWGIPVWSTDRALTWLSKISSGIETEKPRRKCKLVELKAPYVKFEAFDRRHRPVFKEIRNWPSFNFAGSAGSAAVLHKPTSGQQIMTKSRAPPQRNKVRSAPVQSGYCELCREEYQNLGEHLESKKHLTFIRNNDNFLELDTLIQNGTDLNSFLKLANKCHGDVESLNTCTTVSHKMPRTRPSSINDCNLSKVKNVPVSPTGSEPGHRLRTRKSNMTYIGLTAQEQEEQIKPEGAKVVRETRELRSATRIPKESDTWKSGRPKRLCLRQKRNSFLEETGLHVETRGYYKLDMTPKLRSSAITTQFKEYKEVDLKKSPLVEETETDQYIDDKSLLVKFRRMRTSELQLLNNEAENFLFPKKDDTSSEEDIDGDCRDTTVSTHPGDSIVISSETDIDKGSIVKSEPYDELCCDKTENTECKKKRRSQAETFIEDNKKYYKFETPGSRLRYHGSALTSGAVTTLKKGRVNGDVTRDEIELATVKIDQSEYDIDEDKKDELKFTLDELQFSFETVPKSEPWFETFSRQDQGAEFYTCFSDSGYWKPFLLPYEMDRIQPLDPKVCIQTYTQIKKILATEGSSGSNSTPSCTTPDCSAQGSPAPETDENSKASEDSALSQTIDQPNLLQNRRRRKKGILIPSKNPRKSPRQHASTLAILSSLIQHRKKRKSNSPNSILDSIPEASASQDEETTTIQGKKEDVNNVVESIDAMLTNAFSDMEPVEISMNEDIEGLDFSCRSDAIEILEDYDNFRSADGKAALGRIRRIYSPGKKPGRKKKKNRTGWPKNIRKTNLNVVINKTLDDEGVGADTTGTGDVSEQGLNSDQTVNVNVNSNPISDDLNDRVNQVHMETSVSSVEVDKWENADKVLSTKITNDANKESPVNDAYLSKEDGAHEKNGKRRLRSSSSPPRTPGKGAKRTRRMPASPKSPRVLRKPRGRWYRER